MTGMLYKTKLSRTFPAPNGNTKFDFRVVDLRVDLKLTANDH